jgi:hypothetical protein
MKTQVRVGSVTRSISVLLVAGGLGGIASTALAQQGAAPISIAKLTAVDVPQIGAPPTGPHRVVIEHDPGLATHTIYRPSELSTDKHPVLVWGEGACAKNGLMFPEYLSEIASHGFVVIADGPPVPLPAAGGGPAPGGGRAGGPEGGARAGGPGAAGAAPPPGAPGARGPAGGPPPDPASMVNGTALVAALDWLEAESADSRSRFHDKVDVERVAAMGMSCGGLMSYGASSDPRVTTVGIWNSGLFPNDNDPGANAKIYDGIRGSAIIVTGGESDIAYANGKRDFELMPGKVPTFYGVYPSVGHGGTYQEDNGGAYGVAAVAWLKWQLMGDTSAAGRGYFVGDGCGICNDSNWTVDSRSLR